MSKILTKAALALKNADTNFEFVKFEAHKPKKKQEGSAQNIVSSSRKEVPRQPKKDPMLKKIRHEVVKFGMSGFDPTKKEEAKIALAVSLGAKPPRKPYVNYKELMQKRKEQKEKAKEERQLMVSKSIMQITEKKKHRGNKNNIGNVLESYGKVQKKDLKKKDDKGPKKKKKNLKI